MGLDVVFEITWCIVIQTLQYTRWQCLNLMRLPILTTETDFVAWVGISEKRVAWEKFLITVAQAEDLYV